MKAVKLCLDDDEDDQVFKRRSLKKTYGVSRNWGMFSSDHALDLSHDRGGDSYGVSINEWLVSSSGHMVNGFYWAVK